MHHEAVSLTKEENSVPVNSPVPGQHAAFQPPV